jgi:hypothetical protein
VPTNATSLEPSKRRRSPSRAESARAVCQRWRRDSRPGTLARSRDYPAGCR